MLTIFGGIREKIVKTEITQGKSTGENEIGDYDKIALEKARTALYDNYLNFKKAIDLFEPLYQKYKLNEEILTDYLYALSNTDTAKTNEFVKNFIQTNQAEPLCLYLARIDIAAEKSNFQEEEELLKKAEAAWPDSVLLKCRRAEFYLTLAETSKDTSYVMLAYDSLSSCGEGSTKLERSWLLKTKKKH